MQNNSSDIGQDGMAGTGDALQDALSSLRQIDSILDDSSEPSVTEECSFELPLTDLLALIPERYLCPDTSVVPGTKVSITVEDLFSQLTAGKVEVSIAKIAFELPPDLLESDALHDKESKISLPLPLIISSLDPQLLAQRTARQSKQYDIEGLPDPFKTAGRAAPPAPEPAPAAPPPQAAPAAPEPPAAPECPPAPAPPPPPPPPPAPAPPPPPPPPPVEVAPLPPVPEPPPMAPPAVPTPEPLPPAPVVEAPPPAAPPEPLSPVAEPVRPPEPTAVPPPAPVAAPPVSPEPPAFAAADRDVAVNEAGELGGELLGGVNLNTATVEQLLTLQGVTKAIAGNIVAYREANGPFPNIFALFDVPRVGRRTFKRITGMVYSEKHSHRRQRLARLLGLPLASTTQLRSIAQALAAERGILGCIISDKEGFMLVESHVGEYAESLSAVVPGMLQQMCETMDMLRVSDIESTSFSMGGRMHSIFISGDTYLTLVHDGNRISKAQWLLGRRVANEIGWILSRRGYV